MRCPSLLFSLALISFHPVSAFAAERVIWKLGQVDYSDHEFGAPPTENTPLPVLVRVGTGGEEKQWPKSQPGSGNGAMGSRPYPYTLAFNLAQAPRGTFYLNLDLLFRQPRVPSLEVEINGHRGLYFFKPRPTFTLGDENDQFNPIHSAAQRRIALPADLLRAGENHLTLTCLDDPPVVTHNRTVGGEGDSGLYYDAISFSNDPETVPSEKLEVLFEPTFFYRHAAEGLVEECWLTVQFPEKWRGREARITVDDFNTSVDLSGNREFGEARHRVLVPDRVAAGVARISLRGIGKGGTRVGEQTFSADFAPRRKWKIFYAPHEHLDIGFTDYRAKVAEVFARNIDALLDLFNTRPDYRFNLDGSWIVEQWLTNRTARQASRLAEHARAGRIGLNAFYAGFVTDHPALEELIRGLYLSKQLETRYGVPFDYGLVTDIPSASWSVPSVLSAAGIRYFVDGGNQDRGPFNVYGHWNLRSPFWWEGPDGARVLAFFSYHYHQLKAVFGLPPAIESGREGLPRFLEPYERADYAPDAVLLYGTEVENLPLDYADADFVARWDTEYAYPHIITCCFAEYFKYIEDRFSARMPVVRGEGGAYWGDSPGEFAAATARDRANQTRAVAAETLGSLTATLDSVLRFPHELDHKIWRNLLRYAEHSYGSFRTRRQPEHDEVVGQLEEKNSQSLRAQQDIDQLMRRSMSQLADQIQTQGENMIVFNPLSWARSGLVRFQVDVGATLTDVAANQSVDFEVVEERNGYQTIRFWAHEVPSLGYRVYRLGHGAARRPGRSEPGSNVVQNRFYRITFDPERAALKSLYDKELGRELVDGTSPYRLNECLEVDGGGSESGRGEGPEATQLLHPWPRLPLAELTIHHAEQGEIVAVEKTPWGHVVKLTARTPHTPRIETEIFLPDDEKRIDIRNRIEKELLLAKEAVYFAFPWAMSNPIFRFDIANAFVDPVKDLMDGAESEWFSVQQAVNVEDGSGAATLAVVDAPLITLGDINRGRWPRKFSASSATVFSYALNNYWSSKWGLGKTGDFTFCYSITSARSFDPQEVARIGREARFPLEISELKSSDKLPGAKGQLPPGAASLAEIAPDSLVVTALKAAEDGQGLVVRVLETAGKASEGRLSFPQLTIASAHEANAVEVSSGRLESDAHSARFRIAPHQVKTIRVTPQ